MKIIYEATLLFQKLIKIFKEKEMKSFFLFPLQILLFV